MVKINAMQSLFDEVILFDRQEGYFTELRVDKDTIPKGIYYYELRHGDDDSYPCAIEDSVIVNYFGAVFTEEPISGFEENGMYIEVGYDDFYYTGEKEYLKNAIHGIGE